MDIGKSITYPFEDKEWAKKLLLGIIISIVPILNFAWIGYMLRTMRNVYDGAETLLPDWSEFGDKFVKGLLVSIASFIYSLPAWIVLIPAGLLWIIPALARSEHSPNHGRPGRRCYPDRRLLCNLIRAPADLFLAGDVRPLFPFGKVWSLLPDPGNLPADHA